MSTALQTALKDRPHDMIGSFEALYDVDSDDEHWLRKILESIHPALDQGGGMMGMFYEATSDGGVRFWGHDGFGTAAEVLKAALPTVNGLEGDELQYMYLQCPRVMASASEILGIERVQEFGPHTPLGALGFADTIGIKCHEPEGWGVMLGLPAFHLSKVDAELDTRWSRFAAHLTAALRIRRRLRIAEGKDILPDAVLTAQGTVSHAEELAKSPRSRELLTYAVRARESARGPIRRTDPEEAVGLWQALVSGRWTLLDQVDSDGRRWILARRNAPASRVVEKLSDRERQVLAYVTLGHSNKLIAYTLGLSVAAVGNVIARASRKLGSRSRVELVELLAKNGGNGGGAA
jgi:DNA-binding CsgD family transcriptional regulator